MAGVEPSLDEITATVERMERRFADHPLFAEYVRLRDRFDADLSGERDRALSKAAALMLIKFAAEPKP